MSRRQNSPLPADATNFDGQPFNGRTVAEYFGNHGAAIAALAKIIKELLPPPPKKGKPAPNHHRPHEFLGGFEIDPMQPNICQICERPHSEHEQ